MKIYKNEFGWSTSAHNKEKGIKYYVDFQFPRNDEPMGDYVEGDLIFRLPNGKESNCFLSSYKKKDGSVHAKVVVMGNKQPLQRNELNVQQTLGGSNRDITGHIDPKVNMVLDEFDEDDLPF